jgi:release factor glutamine methyltransferase
MNAERLLMFTLDCDRAYLYAHPEHELTKDEHSRYQGALNERARGIPAQYITGHQEFWGMDFIVTPAVLIPRPETEHVIETVLELVSSDLNLQTSALSPTKSPFPQDLGSEVRGAKRDPKSEARAPRIVDVGTGSGCIALALAKELPSAEIHATDISAAALEIARANAARHGLENRVRLHQTNLLERVGSGFDFVVSNPPYVGESEADQVQLEVRKFEPRNAVFAGPTGVEVIERLIPQAASALLPGGWLVFEISGTIAQQARDLLVGWDDVNIVPDLQSIPRVVRARKMQ